MRLINTSSLEMEEFVSEIPGYAILSHRWGSLHNEVSFKDYSKSLKRDTSGWLKICNFCEVARNDGWQWAWVDTCCIDKRSSAELSESINSMYMWYERAGVCFVFLEDVENRDEWLESEWWSRGWTLQELIAPSNVSFYDRGWLKIGTKFDMGKVIEAKTNIPTVVLLKVVPLVQRAVAERMSWAAGRRTTRVEDIAYCLLGLFQINMPLLYGEGDKAFQRLQLEILQKDSDESILAWLPGTSGVSTVLADHPDCFRSVVVSQLKEHPGTEGKFWETLPDSHRPTPPRVTSWGIEMNTILREVELSGDLYIEGKLQTSLWAMKLARVWDTHTQVIPHILILMHRGKTLYSRYDCLFCPNGEIDIARHYDFKTVHQPGEKKIVYLKFDRDFEGPLDILHY